MNSKVLENLEVFVDIVKAGGFSPAARQRGLAASSVARQIDSLEAELQTPLFTRSTRSLKLTKAGELLHHRAVRILEDLARTRTEVTALDQQVQGILQVSCFPTFGRRYVLECVPRLFENYPALRIELDLTENLIAPTVERQDVAIRFGGQPDSSLMGHRIASQRYLVCASPAYLARHGRPVNCRDLGQHRLIDKRHRTSALGWREVLTPRDIEACTVRLECDDFEAQRLAALAGVGIARLPDWVTGLDVLSGSLVELQLEDLPGGEDSGIYLLHASRKPSANFSAFLHCLQEVVGTPPLWLCRQSVRA